MRAIARGGDGQGELVARQGADEVGRDQARAEIGAEAVDPAVRDARLEEARQAPVGDSASAATSVRSAMR